MGNKSASRRRRDAKAFRREKRRKELARKERRQGKNVSKEKRMAAEFARDLVEAAEANPDPGARAGLAREALRSDPDCVEAFLLLARDAATSLDERISFLVQATEAGARAAGLDEEEEAAEESAEAAEGGSDEDGGEAGGEAGGGSESAGPQIPASGISAVEGYADDEDDDEEPPKLAHDAPYVVARVALARALAEAGRREEARGHLEDLLRLAPESEPEVAPILTALTGSR